MISYTLKCCHGHSFEGWFGSSADFDDQQARGFVTCPICETSDISKGLMTPQLPRKGNQKKQPAQDLVQNRAQASNHAQLPQNALQGQPQINPEEVAAVYARMREMQKTITDHCDDVGEQFAEEARKIHYGEAEERGIYGQTSPEEAEALAEEGIEAIPMPWLPYEN